MWEVLLTVEVGKFVLEQVLNLGKSALEDYVKDFFKDCITGSVAAAKAETLKQPMAEAIGQFLKRFVEELQINGVEKPSIDHHYDKMLKRFVKDKAVRPILGKAFETDCRSIDYPQLETIWNQGYQDPGYRFPEDFDWKGIAKKYVFEVKTIVKADAELRSLLEIDLQEQQTDSLKQLAGINPGFDVAKYRESLQCSYGYLKLYTLDSTDRSEPMRLWRMFIEQTVREALPPLRYEIPLDVKRQLQAEGGLEGDLSEEALAVYRQEYFQQPARKVLEAINSGGTGSPLAPNNGGTGTMRAVILGDPGAGKSTLLQYLALEWVEGKTKALPLLIELREYALAGVSGFLEFFHRGKGADWRFDQGQLHQHLLEQKTVVMFDGLDEVFDRATQEAIKDEIIRFGQMYPLAQVLVTSRIIGYNPERLQQAGFQQFTIQPLDRDEVHEFIDRWYDLALGNDGDKLRLVNRLKDAIENSKAIQNLADNPLLLTMMAILNRRQELPRDRADLYDQASRVLLYHWDVDHKRLQLPMDAIGRREKQEMLRLIAYEMQTSEEGLKGNLIRADRLVRILTEYLRDQGFEAPREKANGLIEQLRHRNWILCDRGADTYGFVHRTFLEYFCAMEIVHRFEKSRTITFEQLRDEVFGLHWQDETWHEVLKLICGSIAPQFAGKLIEFLIERDLDKSKFLEKQKDNPIHEYLIKKSGFSNLILAVGCLADVQDRHHLQDISDKLFNIIKQELDREQPHPFSLDAITAILGESVKAWKDNRDNNRILLWLKKCLEKDVPSHVPCCAAEAIIQAWKDDPETLMWLKNFVQQDGNCLVRQTAVREITKVWKDDPATLLWLKEIVRNHNDNAVRGSATWMISTVWKGDRNILHWLINLMQNNDDWWIGYAGIRSLVEKWDKNSEIAELLAWIAAYYPFIYTDKNQINPRHISLEALFTHYPTYPKNLELLHDRAQNDPDPQLRQWAQEQLQKLEVNP